MKMKWKLESELFSLQTPDAFRDPVLVRNWLVGQLLCRQSNSFPSLIVIRAAPRVARNRQTGGERPLQSPESFDGTPDVPSSDRGVLVVYGPPFTEPAHFH